MLKQSNNRNAFLVVFISELTVGLIIELFFIK